MPDGILVMNFSGEKSRYRAHIVPLLEAFSGAIRLVPVEHDDNALLFAFKDFQAAHLPDTLQRRAAYLERGMGLEFSRFLERLRAGQVLGTRDDLRQDIHI